MFSILLSLSLLCTPSVTTIYLGELIPPITALKLKIDDPAPSDGAFLSPSDWITLKTSLEGSVSLCEWAVSEAVASCISECDAQRSDDLLELDSLRSAVTAYEAEINAVKSENESMSERITRYQWSLIGVTSFSTLALFALGLYR